VPTRQQLARFGAPAAFLLGVTIAVLLIRSGLERSMPTTTLGPVTHASTAAVPPPAKTVAHARTGTIPTAGPRYYTVERGDTFGAIAAKEGTTVSALEALNPGVSSNALRVGEKIRVG